MESRLLLIGVILRRSHLTDYIALLIIIGGELERMLSSVVTE